jgi:hypothetical protein
MGSINYRRDGRLMGHIYCIIILTAMGSYPKTAYWWFTPGIVA